MPLWTPKPIWEGKEVFIIGGGDSLRDFDWNFLKDKLTIGCNCAFLLGADICKVCVFGDKTFLSRFLQLEDYKGMVFTNCEEFLNSDIPWLYTMKRKGQGLGTNSLGWGQNTGVTAINLALLFGASKVNLLGFDMCSLKNENWHDCYTKENRKRPKQMPYNAYRNGLVRVAKDLPKVFPGREVINVSDVSQMNCFPKISFKTFWESRKAKENNYERSDRVKCSDSNCGVGCVASPDAGVEGTDTIC